jgi:hypothetical protein
MDYSASDFTTPDNGLDYVFGKMGAIYGASFTRHWDNVDPSLIRQTWKDLLGVYCTYKPTLDFALNSMNTKYIPSALEFKELCSQAGRIPVKPEATITHQRTQEELAKIAIAKEEALAKIKQWTSKVTSTNAE